MFQQNKEKFSQLRIHKEKFLSNLLIAYKDYDNCAMRLSLQKKGDWAFRVSKHKIFLFSFILFIYATINTTTKCQKSNER